MAESVNRVLLEKRKSGPDNEKRKKQKDEKKHTPLHDLLSIIFLISRMGKPFNKQESRNTFNATNKKQQGTPKIIPPN